MEASWGSRVSILCLLLIGPDSIDVHSHQSHYPGAVVFCLSMPLHVLSKYGCLSFKYKPRGSKDVLDLWLHPVLPCLLLPWRLESEERVTAGQEKRLKILGTAADKASRHE